MIVERPALERRVLGSLDAGRIPVVLGACGSGRTSLLLRTAHAIGEDRGQYLDFGAAATTPERCFSAVTTASRPQGNRTSLHLEASSSPRGAFDALMTFFDESTGPGGSQATFLIDEALDIRTFEHFPGLRQVQRDFIARLAASPSRFVLASRFTSRAHRLLRDAPARFEVIHMPALTAGEAQALASRFDGGRRDQAGTHAAAIAALAAGRAAYAHLLTEALASQAASVDPTAALAMLCGPDGRLTARCRESYEFRLHRARGYGALKAILGVLADEEALNLTEIAQHLRRTPGSTKDYLSWLEDVDLVVMRGKRYSYEDPLLRLFVRLYGRPVPPGDADVVREVRAYAFNRLQSIGEPVPVPVAAAADRPAEAGGTSGIIEID